MEALTTLEELRRHIAVLACVDQTEAPFVSCYLNLELGEESYRKALEERMLAVRGTLEGDQKADFDTTMGQIADYLSGMLSGAKGVALFSRHYRGGAFFLPMQFAAPLPNWIAVYPSPKPFSSHGAEDYHRYVVLLTSQACVRILEVNLGAATTKAWTEQPELRQRVGREWTKAHYESHRRERTSRFLKEQIDLLENLMVDGGHTHLIWRATRVSPARYAAHCPSPSLLNWWIPFRRHAGTSRTMSLLPPLFRRSLNAKSRNHRRSRRVSSGYSYTGSGCGGCGRLP